jgi:4-methylaminobutanoate oxidase (formaldehyde-forming)
VGDAILIERNQLTSGTTWHSAAQVRALRSTRNLTDLIKYSVALYGELEAETGQATGWINAGSLSIASARRRSPACSACAPKRSRRARLRSAGP